MNGAKIMEWVVFVHAKKFFRLHFLPFRQQTITFVSSNSKERDEMNKRDKKISKADDALSVKGTSYLFSAKSFALDPAKKYQISGEFSQKGGKQVTLYFGFATPSVSNVAHISGLIFGFLMTGVMSFTVFADEAESPPDAVLAGENTEDALSGEDALASPEALAESLSEEMNADSDDSKAEDAQSAESASDLEAFTAQKADGSPSPTS